MHDHIPMTREVHARLRADFEQVEQTLAALRDRATEAADEDEREIFAAEAAREMQQLARRREVLDEVFSRAQVAAVDGTVIVGTRVRVRDADHGDDEYVLVAPGEADPRAGKISIESPLGRALLGRRIGETAEVGAPDGTRAVIVLEIR
jgi:transcription elongation GreA/GreB family factor